MAGGLFGCMGMTFGRLTSYRTEPIIRYYKVVAGRMVFGGAKAGTVIVGRARTGRILRSGANAGRIG